MEYPERMKGDNCDAILKAVKKVACDELFNAIEITTIQNPETRQKVKKMLDTSHMAVGYGGQPRLLMTGQNINDLDEEQRRIALANCKGGIDEAYEMGAKGFAFLSGKYQEETKEESYEQLLKSTRELCDYAAAKGEIGRAHV